MTAEQLTRLEATVLGVVGGYDAPLADGWWTISDVMQACATHHGKLPSRQGVQLCLERLTNTGALERQHFVVGPRKVNRYMWRVPR